MNHVEINDNIIELRLQGLSYNKIAELTNTNKDDVYYQCRKYIPETIGAVTELKIHYCARCGKRVFKTKGGYNKYCNECRLEINKPIKTFAVCEVCEKTFEQNYKDQQYCSKECANSIPRIQPEIDRVCTVCGKHFQGKKQSKYCSKECEELWRTENPRHSKVCGNCGKRFKTNYKAQKFCSAQCATEHTTTLLKGREGKKHEEDNVELTVNQKYDRFEYIGGYTGSEGTIYLICKDCGEVFKYTAQILRPSANRQINCPGCQTITSAKRKRLNEERRKSKSEEKQRADQLKRERKERERLSKLQNKVCPECGKVFDADRIGKLYCSKECQKRVGDRNKALKKRNKVMTNGVVDWGISLTKLIKRDNNTCHICGGKCDKNDYTHDDKGSFIAGRNYPSVDHVNPIAKGGTHTWDNVKLAHFRCNSIKRDKLCYEGKGEQMTMVV